MLVEISQLEQWDKWMSGMDGKSVMREIERIYTNNTEFMKKF